MPAESLHVRQMEGFEEPVPDPPPITPLAQRPDETAAVAAPAPQEQGQ